MLIHGILPDNTAFTCMLFGCSHGGDVAAGRSSFHSMAIDFHLEGGRRDYGCMIDLLGRAGYLEDAIDLVETMPYPARVDDWICLLGSCRRISDARRATRAASRAVELDRAAAPYILLANKFSFSF
ncbi:hypothetical protein SELMODRAFT_118770 [Selaginella moellendorffii]|uniref:Pentatricopeptide repeat-containing protein n=2 Tax=Selaginella moellendorffii TaxID=88036 RepID=D8SJU4_SELML|nr:hypothetical protein SELMODRAFT_118770 [Selaginella moellendorffii]